MALNSGPLLREAATLEPLAPARVDELLRDGATLLDGRAPEAWAAGHVPGSVSATRGQEAVGSRAAAAVDPSRRCRDGRLDEEEARMARRPEAVGFRQALGLLAGGVDAWREAGLEVELVESIDVPELAHRLRGRLVVALDVRDADEWQDAHVPDSLHLPYHELSDTALEQLRAAENGQPYAVVCGAGNRASLAASLLRRAGVRGVVHVGGGGVSDLAGHGIELDRSAGMSAEVTRPGGEDAARARRGDRARRARGRTSGRRATSPARSTCRSGSWAAPARGAP